MKIGAGGLQSQVTWDSVPVDKVEAGRQKSSEQVVAAENSNYQGSVNRNDLLKAVDKLNGAAELFNRPYRFSLNKNENAVSVKTAAGEQTRVLKEIPADKVLDMVDNMNRVVGAVLDEHV